MILDTNALSAWLAGDRALERHLQTLFETAARSLAALRRLGMTEGDPV